MPSEVLEIIERYDDGRYADVRNLLDELGEPSIFDITRWRDYPEPASISELDELDQLAAANRL